MSDTRTLEIVRSTSTAHRLSEYDGVCGAIHGHNIHWEVEATVDMSDAGTSNMPIDLKDISSLIDDVDHAAVLCREDELLRFIINNHDHYEDKLFLDNTVVKHNDFVGEWDIKKIGQTFVFASDPTCELLSQWMADRIEDLDPVISVDLMVYETDKYGIRAVSDNTDSP
jgi:6-pyruvoyl-tetrahydropterin synthase